ncbi:hypothetical protein [Amycolatopsis orientalis]|nr:hypothetical protein [Amycolatopsis orientalis]
MVFQHTLLGLRQKGLLTLSDVVELSLESFPFSQAILRGAVIHL